MYWLHFIILLPFLFTILIPIFYKKIPRIHTGWFVLFLPLLLFVYFLSYISDISKGEVYLSTINWIPSYDINFTMYMDGLSLIFSLLIAGIGALVILYSIYYLSKKREALHNFYIYLMLFMGAMLGLVFSDNIYVLYVFWEITSISSFLLIAYWYERENSRYGAQKSMLITIFGGFSLLAGLIMLSLMADTTSIRELISYANTIQSHDLFIPAMIFLLLGAFTKSAQFPFSIWLPSAMEAPTPISAYLHSATMVKAGIYLVARVTPIFGGTVEWFWIVTAVGIITLFYGSINAVKQTDLKALLAYSTISQLGLILSLFGLGSAGLYKDFGTEEASLYAFATFAGIFHLVNHSTFKGSLFMVVGIIDHETGTRDIRKLGGIMHLMPISFTLTVIGGLSMAGLPPFNGFLSKEMFFTSVVRAIEMDIFHMEFLGIAIPIIAWIASVFTFVYCMILIFKTFRRKNSTNKLDKEIHEAPLGLLISPVILAILVITFYFIPNHLADNLLKPAFVSVMPALTHTAEEIHISAWHGFNVELMMTIGVVLLGTILYLLLRKWYKLYRYYPQTLTLNNFYQLGLNYSERISNLVTKLYMTGYVRDYLVYIFAFLILITGGTFLYFHEMAIETTNDAPVNFFEVMLMLALIISAGTVLFTKSRVTSIVSVGALGFLVSLLFVLFRAPDLALTQLVVETVTTVLFLLCLYHLPKLKKEIRRIRFKLVNGVISLGVGIVVTLVALAANGSNTFDSISEYYKDSYDLAGAKNIVNAILVDFRGMDTLLEIIVLTIAGIGVYTLIKVKNMGGGNKNEKFK